MDIQIRRVKGGDVGDILEQIDKTITFVGDVWTAAQFQDFENILVATTLKDTIVGYLVYEIGGTGNSTGNTLHIYNLGVDLQHQRQGVGTKLLEFVKQMPNISSVTLEVAVNNQKALGLYRRMGFCVEHEISHYYGLDQHAYFARLNLP